MRYIDSNRASWIVMYAQATSSQTFAHTVREGRERIIALVSRILESGTRNPEPGHRLRDDRGGAGGRRRGDRDPAQYRRHRRRRAAELMINLFWRGLKGYVPTERDAAEPTTESG